MRLLSGIAAKRYYNPRRLKYRGGVCNVDQHRDRMHRALNLPGSVNG